MYYIGEEEIEALKKLFSKKKLYRYNANHDSECDLFEKEFSQHMGVEHSILLSSGTNALSTALLSYELKENDEVIIPAYTFVATATAVIQAGARPIIVNNDSRLGIDLEDLKNKIGPKTKAVIIVHMDGLAANVKELKDFCRNKNLILIEDVAQAMGGSYEGVRLGAIGDAGCFSLNENKVLSCGEGGIVVFNKRENYERAFCIHDTPSQFNPYQKSVYQNIVPFIGSSMRVSEIQGTIMRVQLNRLEKILSELRQRKEIFKNYLKNKVVVGYSESGDCGSSLHLQFSSAEEAIEKAKVLREKGLLFAPVTARPAHAAWKWIDLLNRHYLSNENTKFLANYHTSQYLPTIEILMKIIKLDISLDWTSADVKKKAKLVKEICGEC